MVSGFGFVFVPLFSCFTIICDNQLSQVVKVWRFGVASWFSKNGFLTHPYVGLICSFVVRMELLLYTLWTSCDRHTAAGCTAKGDWYMVPMCDLLLSDISSIEQTRIRQSSKRLDLVSSSVSPGPEQKLWNYSRQMTPKLYGTHAPVWDSCAVSSGWKCYCIFGTSSGGHISGL